MPNAAPTRPLLLVCCAALALACGQPSADSAPSVARPGGPPGGSGSVAERAAAILANDDTLDRARDFAVLLTELDAEALPDVRGALEGATLDSTDGDIALLLFATWWAGFDPEGALAWANRDWRAPTQATTSVLRTWAERDPKAAWSGISSIRPEARSAAKAAIIASWYRRDPADLQAFVMKLPKGELQQKAMEGLALEKTKELGGEAALAWADGLPASEFRNQMRKRVAGAVGLLEPEVAAAWATPQIDDGHRTNGLARRIATRWVLSDPEAAMAWLSTLPAGGTRYDGVLEAYRDWLSLSPIEAVRWIHGREVEPWLEPAISLYARAGLVRDDPERAFALVSEFEDERLRESTYVYMARKWLRRDREAADAWIQQSDLPEGVKKRSYMLRAPRQERSEHLELGLPGVDES